MLILRGLQSSISISTAQKACKDTNFFRITIYICGFFTAFSPDFPNNQPFFTPFSILFSYYFHNKIIFAYRLICNKRIIIALQSIIFVANRIKSLRSLKSLKTLNRHEIFPPRNSFSASLVDIEISPQNCRITIWKIVIKPVSGKIIYNFQRHHTYFSERKRKFADCRSMSSLKKSLKSLTTFKDFNRRQAESSRVYSDCRGAKEENPHSEVKEEKPSYAG